MASQSGYSDPGGSGQGLSSELLPKDLPSKRLLGKGLASIGYETELNGQTFARKDFIGVPISVFKNEASKLVCLKDHQNVVKTYGLTVNKTSCSLVLEYMDNDFLAVLKKRKRYKGSLACTDSGSGSELAPTQPFELPEALGFMLQIARGMEHVHEQGIVHGDLKTKNILVTNVKDGDKNMLSVKVADFGLVRTKRKSMPFVSRQARKLDMARWKAPEKLEMLLLEDKNETSSESGSDSDSYEGCTGSSSVSDLLLSADVYSFALTCFHIVTGDDPYPNLNWKELVAKIVSGELKPNLASTFPPLLRDLLESCWRKVPAERPTFSLIRRKLEHLQILHPLQVMGKPDIVNAFLGATIGSGVVGPILDKVIEGLKFVYHCREQCTALREELEKVKPLLERISGQHQADSAMKNWLSAFEDCVEKADEVQKKCKSDSSSIWERGYEVKYGREILELNKKISENIKLAPMAHLALQSESKSTRACGIMQHVPDKILGMDHHFKRMRSAITEGHRRKDSRCCVGVRGMGGAGKTLLAQMVNNDEEIRQEFGKESIIWITVGRDAEISVIYERMRKCLGVRNDGGSLEDQRTQLVNEFLKRSVLLILDDIWDGIVYEFKEMVYWLDIARGAGSVTVVTTRDEAITRKYVNAGEEIILRLSEEQSWELFRTHAFGTEIVPLNRDLEAMARDVCEECQCLPLALKVIGRAMKGKRDIREWRKTLRKLQDSSKVNKRVEKEMFERLRISYDQLDEPIKTCFLYFAAFPEDCEIPVEHLCQVWIVEGLFGEELDKEEALDAAHCALNELLRQSLIERDCADQGNPRWVKMHDILRDLAILISGEGNESERESLFKMERGLGQFPNSWLVSSLKVKRLSLWGNKMKRFPANFRAPTLRVCMLYPEAWNSWKEGRGRTYENSTIEEGFFRNMQELKYLQMCANKELQHLPESIGGLRSLQYLDISRSEALQELPESIGGLGSLQHLNVSECEVLQQLPESIGGLGSLQHLNISECEALQQLPESIGGLGSLQHLDISQSMALQQFPESIGRLGSLQHLDISRCNTLQQLPESIGGLGSLQHLDVSQSLALQQLPESIGRLGSLQHLDISGCNALQQLPESIGELGCLQFLDISWCDALQQLPESIGGLGSLQHLDISRCDKVRQLPESIRGLGSLQHLDISWCDALQQLPESIGGLGCLQFLDISGCCALQQLPKSIGGLGSLQHFKLSNCKALQQLPESIGGLGSLQHLNISECEALQQLPESIGGLGSLRHLDISWCNALQQLPESIRGLWSLQHLGISGCYALQQLPESIGGLGSLQHLDVSQSLALQQLPESIGRLGSLQHLDISGCNALQQLPESIGGLGSLQHLDISWCDALQQLPESIGGLGCLQVLDLSNCKALQELPKSIKRLASLQSLNLLNCKALQPFREFRNASRLQIIF